MRERDLSPVGDVGGTVMLTAIENDPSQLFHCLNQTACGTWTIWVNGAEHGGAKHLAEHSS